MRYLFLLYGDEQAEQSAGEDELKRIVAAHGEFSAGLRAAGKLVTGAGLEASSTATVVRRDTEGADSLDASRPGLGTFADQVTDGPYAETREQIGGLYLVDCDDLDDALDVARRIPYSPGLTIEVRPAPY